MKKICYLVPAHNEECVIGKTIESLLAIADKNDIYVVNDGSEDKTKEIAGAYAPNILNLYPNVGKATAINSAIKHFSLSQKYKYIMPMDADTVVTADFLNNTLPILEKDVKEKLACVVGRVEGKSHNWITSYRIWEYEVAQTIHKSAQNETNSVIVCPGCATIYRTKVFDTVQIPKGTLTEDMDFTFDIHRKHLGKIYFTNKASVVTQDPNTLRDFIRQIDRWYTGFWQCVVKHDIPWQGQTLDIEVALLALEGLFNGLLMIGFIFLIPYSLIKNPHILLYPLGLDLFLFMIPSLFFVAIKTKLWKIFLYTPLFYVMRITSSFIFLTSFVKVVLGLDLKMKWSKANRYQPA